MKKLFWLVIITIIIVVSCKENASNNDFDLTNDSDQVDEAQDADAFDTDSDASDFDDELSDSENFKCKGDSNCGENEVCDPYGDCVCDVDKGYFFKYNGSCITYLEANRLFCNGHAGMMDVNSEILKGRTAFIEKGNEDDVYCSNCLLGYVGRFCERKMEGYNDTVQEFNEADNRINFLTEPYCKKNSECVEGLSCVNGYCECEGDVEFNDPKMASLISSHLGSNTVRSVFSGKELLKITAFQLMFYDNLKDIGKLRCLSNIRILAVPTPGDGVDMTEVTYLKKVQHLAVVMPLPADIFWIKEMDNLLSLDLTLWCVDFDLFKDFKSRNSLAYLELYVFHSDSCKNLDWSLINGFKNLQRMAIISDPGCMSELDMSFLSGMSHLKEIYVRSGSTEETKIKVKNINVLNTLDELTRIGIDAPDGYTLDDLNRNENIISLVIDDHAVSKKIADVFPNLIELTHIDLGRKNDASVLSGLTRLLQLKIDNNVLHLEYPELENVLPEMEHLRTLLISPFEGRSDLNFLKNMKYIERIQFLTESPNQDKRDISAMKDLLYLWIFEDITGGSTTFEPFVENCNNGGSFCRQDANRYINEMKEDDGTNYRRIYFDSPLLDPESEMDNINFLKDQGVIVEYDY